jgi:hypothetical protein
LKDLLSGEPFDLSEPRKISIAGGSLSCSPEVVRDGNVKTSWTPLPCWCAVKSVIGAGIGGEGGCGSPGAPQPLKVKKKRIKIRKSKRCLEWRMVLRPFTEFAAPAVEFRVSYFDFYRMYRLKS